MSHEHGRDSTATGCREPVPSSRISSGRPPVLDKSRRRPPEANRTNARSARFCAPATAHRPRPGGAGAWGIGDPKGRYGTSP